MLLGRSFRLSCSSHARTHLASPPVRKENLALRDSKEQWFIGIWTFWLGFIGLTFWLGFIGNMDLLLGSSGIWTFWLAAIRLISYAFKGQMNDLCRKVKWSERPEPRASNIPGLGAWTRPPDRRWRITARGRGWRSACSRPGLERLPTRDSQHQS